MKILQFVTRLDLGGAQEICLDLCERLLEDGHEVHLLTAGEGELLPRALTMSGLQLHLWPQWGHRIRPMADLDCTRKLAAMLREKSFDILHTHSSKAGLVGRSAAAWARTPTRVIHHVHGWSFNRSQTDFKRTAYTMLERAAARPGMILLSCCHATDRSGRVARIGRDADRRVVVNGVELRTLRAYRPRAEIRRRLGLGVRDVLFLQLGNLKPQKDPETFARAALTVLPRLSRARFWIAGDGPLRSAVEELAGEDTRLRVLGWRRDVDDLLAAADVLVLTSRFEGLPMAVLRGMAAGLPVVATAVDGTPEAVRDGREGFLVPVGDVGAVAEACLTLGRDPGLRARMGHSARSRSACFTEKRAIHEVLAIYRSLKNE